MVVIFR